MAAATRRLRVALATLLALAAVIAVAPPTTSSGSSELVPVVVHAKDNVEDAVAAVTAAGGVVRQKVELISGAVAAVPANRLGTVARDPRVDSVTPDYPLQTQAATFDGTAGTAFSGAVGATNLWSGGLDGRGVGVGLLDTGIADHPDLAGKVRASADLTSEGSFADSYGHGTFLAGLVAGGGPDSPSGYSGVAPGAHLVSIKIAGADGKTSLGQVLYGLQLLDASKERYDVRVVLVALAGPVPPGPGPLEMAVERLWADGLFVVVAAGNTGPGLGTVTSPGVDPYVFTVGALNDAGTATPADDSVPTWTARGAGPLTKPDVVAPGVSVVSLRANGSTIDSQNPKARIGDGYFRGSGTSMSAAVAAGGAALLLQSNPKLTPDQVKGRLLDSARPAPKGAEPAAVGRGSLDVAAAAASTAGPANQGMPRLSSGRITTPPDPNSTSARTFDWFASPVGPDRWLGRSWAAAAWSGTSWQGWSWAGRAWSDWSGWSWANGDWQGWSWANNYWQGWSWAGWSWAGWSWAGWSWAGWSWAGWSWAGWSWAGWSWSGWSWASFAWG